MKERMDAESSIPKGEAVDNQNVVGARDHEDSASVLDPEVIVRPQRRTFTAEYKERILEAVDACQHGEVGPLLRHEGLHYSTVKKWRKARDLAVQRALTAQKPGPAAKEPNPIENRVAELERELKQVKGELAKAKVIIDVQKKVSELLALGSSDGNGETS